MYRSDRTWRDHPTNLLPKVGGGLCTYINDSIHCNIDELGYLNLSCKDIETQYLVLLDENRKNSVVCTVYRPPQGNPDNSFDLIDVKCKNVKMILLDFGKRFQNYYHKKNPKIFLLIWLMMMEMMCPRVVHLTL